MKRIGIYKITNTNNNKIYVGSSSNLDKRYYRHLNSLRNNIHHNIHLQRSYNIYGEESFEFSIIEDCDENILVEREEYYIKNLNALGRENGYNINPKCDRPPSWLGKTHTEKTKLKMGLKSKGRIPTQHSKDVASLTHKGKTISEEHKELLRSKNTGNGNPMFSKSVYDVWLDKYGKDIADDKYNIWIENKRKGSQKGENNSSRRLDVRKKIGDAHRGKILSEETKQKISLSKRGIKLSEETKQKMSLKKIGENNNSCKIKDKDVLIILERLEKGESPIKISKEYNVSKTTIYNIKKGKRKTNLEN